ncbi:sugar kinase [Halovenus sp. WSH3]|uniref:Sugar kinase n=1 Tax=Halovenus carboxidivorans TaxID=2692199 RepID=A0A6B0T116_9EURY|nr:PfkB family carbohydrate kinase [Halovenus carboxidivorans]MXR51605.1 sugar kinase [Halovenus carboxidivorans]
MTELITFGETPLRLSPTGDQRLEQAREATIHADGTASNVAVAADELGAETLWLSKLPESPLGRRVQSQIEEQGVETAVAWSEDPAHRQGLLFREGAAAPRGSKQWHDRGNTAAATATPAEFPMDRVQETEIIFAGLGTAVLSQEAAETTGALLRAAGGSGAMTAVDLDYSQGLAPPDTYSGVLETLAADIDVLFAEEESAREALDRSGGPRELANTIAAEYDLEIIVIRRSDRGAVALRDSPGTNIIHERETVETETVDPTGEMGAFVGAFLERLIDGSDTARSLSYAVAAATLSRTVPGPFLTTTAGELDPIAETVVDKSR